MKQILVFLLLAGTLSAQQIEQIGFCPCILTDLIVTGHQHAILSCKEGYIIEWTPTSRDTIADFSSVVEIDGESGLLGIAMLNDTLYANYTDFNYNKVVVRVEPLDTLTIIYTDLAYHNHRGGDMDSYNGYLYLSVGEGVAGVGYVLRYPDTIAWGLRNPWKIHAAEQLYITDVGAHDYEEINLNDYVYTEYGWPCYEGPMYFGGTCENTEPWVYYPRASTGSAIIGGYLSSQGYLFADHYHKELYITDGTTIDTFPGIRYLTAIDDDMAVDYNGRVYEISFPTGVEGTTEGTSEGTVKWFSVMGVMVDIDRVPPGIYFDNYGHKVLIYRQ